MFSVLIGGVVLDACEEASGNSIQEISSKSEVNVINAPFSTNFTWSLYTTRGGCAAISM
jgi:hypothetical protein